MLIEHWFFFCIIITAIVLCPGPINILVLANSINYGLKKTIVTILGGVMAYVFQMLFVMVSLHFLLTHSNYFLEIVEILGAAYLIYFGWRQWNYSATSFAKITPNVYEQKDLVLFVQGFITAGSNPKTLLIFSLIFPHFMANQKPFLLQYATLGTSFSVLQFLAVLIYATWGVKLAYLLTLDKKPFLINKLIGGMLILAGIMLFLAGVV